MGRRESKRYSHTHTHTGSWGPSDRVRGNRRRVRRGGEGWEISTLEGGKDNDR